jgi:hypothetical protein
VLQLKLWKRLPTGAAPRGAVTPKLIMGFRLGTEFEEFTSPKSFRIFPFRRKKRRRMPGLLYFQRKNTSIARHDRAAKLKW